ncbi:MAG: AraC family transcriptional regulator [Phototrophicales bacterium]|nr:MAG: AraC family transcriptional regulator [Phototrophicales bacterium]
MSIQVAILIFDEVEVLDFAGPFEVFAITSQDSPNKPFDVYLVAEEMRPIRARHGFSVNPHYTLETCPTPDIVLVPGGKGSRIAKERPAILNWVRHHAQQNKLTLSVCTGALILGRAGILDGLSATTHWTAFDLLAENAPKTNVQRNIRFIDNGQVITSAGVSAGIDMSLYVVARLCGIDVAQETAREMEYTWTP